MKRILPVIILLLSVIVCEAQKITHARLVLNRAADGFRTIELQLDSHYLVGMSGDGAILYVETAGGETVDDLPLTYYDQFDIHDIPGKLKSIGDIKIAYNNVFDVHAARGTIKSIGDLSIRYYDVFDIHDPRGKVKSVGDIVITYYNDLDSRDHFGLIKSISGNSRQLTVTQHHFIARYPFNNPRL